jgi:heme/copper-type cytochrome/quinol oxidase subunit 3
MRPQDAAGRTGMILFLFSEAMLFAALVSAFIVLSAGAPSWPPPGQPRLPFAATAGNMLILLLSGATMMRAVTEVRRAGKRVMRWLAVTVALGLAFLVGQGLEWGRLLGFGVTTQSSIYGATFYSIVGIHATHVVAALVVLAVSLRRARHGAFTAARHEGLVLASWFWLFVVLVWPILYTLLY